MSDIHKRFNLDSEKSSELARLSRNRTASENWHGFSCPDPRVAEVEAIATPEEWAAYCERQAADCVTRYARAVWSESAAEARSAKP